MKDFGKIRSRMSLKNFLTDVETGLIHEWSMERNPIFVINSKEVDNVNVKSFQPKPVMSTNDWDLAWKWDQKNKKVIKLNDENKIIYMTPAGDTTDLTKSECKEFLSRLKKCEMKSLGELLSFIETIYILEIDENHWENSKCSCKSWLKDLKCCHMIAIASRLSKNSFIYLFF